MLAPTVAGRAAERRPAAGRTVPSKQLWLKIAAPRRGGLHGISAQGARAHAPGLQVC